MPQSHQLSLTKHVWLSILNEFDNHDEEDVKLCEKIADAVKDAAINDDVRIENVNEDDTSYIQNICHNNHLPAPTLT